MHLGRIITYECMNACCVSQSATHKVLNASDCDCDGVLKGKSLMDI